MAKVTRRLIPLPMVCYFTAYLDRVMREAASIPQDPNLASTQCA